MSSEQHPQQRVLDLFFSGPDWVLLVIVVIVAVKIQLATWHVVARILHRKGKFSRARFVQMVSGVLGLGGFA